jgi:hypothetical protein
MASMLVPLKALLMNNALAAARIAARFSMSFGRPGPWALMGALVLMSSTFKNADSQPLVYASVYLFAMLRQSGPGSAIPTRAARMTGVRWWR